MTRTLPFLAELQPELFCEVSPELAQQRGLRLGVRGGLSLEARVEFLRDPLEVVVEELRDDALGDGAG